MKASSTMYLTRKVPYPLLAVLFAACGGDDASSASNNLSDTELADQSIAKAKECEVYVPPQNPKDDTVQDEFDRCAARCILATDCDTLLEAWCEGGLPAGDPFLSCVQKCPEAPVDGFECNDGTTIPFVAVCDGHNDCGKKEDEQGCEPYVCADGQEIIAKDVHCDNGVQCEDGSDEDDCPLTCELREL